MSDETLALLHKYRTDFLTHAKECLVIRAKDQQTIPFALNQAQRYFHDKIEEQRAKTGRVRALALKGRQQGISTYVAGRFYAKASLFRNTSVFILAHEQAASDGLFSIVNRYHSNNPLAPHTGASNIKELEFDQLDSSYTVATAGAKATGRSKTMHLFHGSEAAFWNNARDHFAASVQAVPDLPGTEIILESTANGVSGEFYERCMDALAERGDYILVFIPWFWSKEYSREVDATFVLEGGKEEGVISEVEYAELYNLSKEQMAWRRAKIRELRSIKLFMQEYPATTHEAFQSTDEHTFIDPLLVVRARKREREALGPLVIGVDPAGPGGDRFAVCWRRGLCVEKIEYRNRLETLEAVEWLHSIIKEDDPAVMYIDAGGLGASVISVLKERKESHRKIIKSINFGGKSQHKTAKPDVPGPKNRRAEMWQRAREWLLLEEGTDLPDMDIIQADLCAPRLKKTMTNDILLESKEDMRSRGVRSPDLADALVLTFADLKHIRRWSEKKPTRGSDASEAQPSKAQRHRPMGGSHGWMR